MHRKVLVLGGGTSSEREVSLRSSASVAQWLRVADCDVTMADPADAAFNLEKAATHCDAVFPILHGKGGEDGALQRQLESTGKAFLGSGSTACVLTWDKAEYRAFMADKGVLMAEGGVVSRAQFEQSALRQRPYVLKPVAGGSTIDTLILHDISQEPDAAYFDDLFARYPTMLLEQLIVGREISVGVLGERALPIVMIVPPDGETFDYTNKYNGRSREILDPPEIPAKTRQEAQELALRLHRLTGCRHLSRSDMIVTAEGEIYVLETNTMPGMTAESLFPKMAAAVGLDGPSLVRCFLEMILPV